MASGWPAGCGIEAFVIHPASIPVSREHQRAKTDRLDTGLLMRAVLGWLRGEPKHRNMAAIPTVAKEDARRRSAANGDWPEPAMHGCAAA
jgi:transposase